MLLNLEIINICIYKNVQNKLHICNPDYLFIYKSTGMNRIYFIL